MPFPHLEYTEEGACWKGGEYKIEKSVPIEHSKRSGIKHLDIEIQSPEKQSGLETNIWVVF